MQAVKPRDRHLVDFISPETRIAMSGEFDTVNNHPDSSRLIGNRALAVPPAPSVARVLTFVGLLVPFKYRRLPGQGLPNVCLWPLAAIELINY